MQGGSHRNDVIVTSGDTERTRKQAKMETKDTCFYEESFIYRSFSVLKILRVGGRGGALCAPTPWLHESKRPMVNRVKKISKLYGTTVLCPVFFPK